ncbi:MAG: hypothetical protein HC945_00325, partial [Nitrosarchaeum sp.]|nr:hypothetical protein [Nitrosarchaeum sp.]
SKKPSTRLGKHFQLADKLAVLDKRYLGLLVKENQEWPSKLEKKAASIAQLCRTLRSS